MNEKIKVAFIGLDTSHATAFPGLMLDKETKPESRIESLLPTRCLRFDTPFQDKEGLDKRQSYLENIGVEVGTDFDWAVEGCDAIILTVNDPALHLEYVKKCAALGKPLFLDKPLAGNLADSRKISDIIQRHNTRMFCASALRFDIDFEETLEQGLEVQSAMTWGPVGIAAAGSSIVWYGVHAFEMLERIMGIGAESVTVVNDSRGHLCHVSYPDGKRGMVELTTKVPRYGALLRNDTGNSLLCRVTGRVPCYVRLLHHVEAYFRGDDSAGVAMADSLEIMKMLEAAEISSQTGKTVYLNTL